LGVEQDRLHAHNQATEILARSLYRDFGPVLGAIAVMPGIDGTASERIAHRLGHSSTKMVAVQGAESRLHLSCGDLVRRTRSSRSVVRCRVALRLYGQTRMREITPTAGPIGREASVFAARDRERDMRRERRRAAREVRRVEPVSHREAPGHRPRRPRRGDRRRTWRMIARIPDCE
jgi:hypothetical protein